MHRLARSIKSWTIERLARIIHAAWRETKIESGCNHHEVNGYPYRIHDRWHQVAEIHREFDRAIARQVLKRIVKLKLWFG